MSHMWLAASHTWLTKSHTWIRRVSHMWLFVSHVWLFVSHTWIAMSHTWLAASQTKFFFYSVHKARPRHNSKLLPKICYIWYFCSLLNLNKSN